MSKDRTWSKVIEEHGVRLRLFERAKGRAVFIEYRRADGSKVRKTTKTTDRAKAEVVAETVALELAEARLTGRDLRSPTLQTVFRRYFELKAPIFDKKWNGAAETRRALFLAAWGEGQKVEDISQTHVDRYSRDRRSGRLVAERKGRAPRGVRDGTLDGDFRWLSSVFNWARKHREDGRRLIVENPLHDVKWPREKNPRRPVASHERYLKTIPKADAIDPEGRLRCIVALARFTGRREGAICALRASDVLRSAKSVRDALALAGMDLRLVEHMPHGAIRWEAHADKQGLLHITPLSGPAREELDRYLRRSPRLGDAPLFPGDVDDTKAIRPDVASRWLLKAETKAKLPKITGGLFHPYRRLWASERKMLPDVDVAAAGGWRDTQALKLSYQQSDAATVLSVVEHRA